MEKLFILQLIAHVITDFFLQTDKMCKKKKDGFKTWHLYWHALLTASIAWAFSFSCKYWMYAFIIGVLHLCMDGVKSRMQKYKYIFFVDQSIHLIIITLAIYIYQQHAEIVLPTYVPSAKWLLYILGFLICLKPTNIAVQKVLSIDDKKKKNDIEQEKEDEMKAAGRKIGILERVLTLLLVIQNQYLAIGFLIAAKSLLRFKDTERAKTEYVLIGTLLSFGTAIVIGILLTDNAQGAKLLLLHIFDFFKRIQT